MADKSLDYESQITSLCEDIELIAHIASHDIKDPLRQALYDLEESNDIQSASQSISMVIEMITLLREYSNIIKLKDKRSEVDCNEILEESLKDISDLINKKNAKINADKLPIINGYQPHIKLLFTSLIKNAICFNDSAEKQLNISCTDDEKFWKFKFSDNGIGIEPFYKKFVFALFQKLDEDNRNQGYGAGLAFCKKIVENHMGEIWFESDGENGTDFYFTISK